MTPGIWPEKPAELFPDPITIAPRRHSSIREWLVETPAVPHMRPGVNPHNNSALNDDSVSGERSRKLNHPKPRRVGSTQLALPQPSSQVDPTSVLRTDADDWSLASDHDSDARSLLEGRSNTQSRAGKIGVSLSQGPIGLSARVVPWIGFGGRGVGRVPLVWL